MSNQTLLKYFFVIVIILVLLSLGFVYIYFVKIAPTSPYQTLTPEVYEEGTIVDLYKETPPGFPKEVVLEDKILNYSGTVTKPNGKIQISVSYISNKSMQDIVTIYEALPGIGWNITEKSVYEKVSILNATKREQNILISIAPLESGETMVTFQYEKN